MPPVRKNRNTAVERVADKLGLNFAEFGDALGISRWSPGYWNRAGGHIPGKHHRAIMALAKKKRVRVTAKDLVNV